MDDNSVSSHPSSEPGDSTFAWDDAEKDLTAAIDTTVAVYDGSDTDPAYVEAITRYNGGSRAVPYTPRSPERIAAYLDGLEIVEPGVVSVSRWRPDPGPWAEPPEVACAGGVGRKR